MKVLILSPKQTMEAFPVTMPRQALILTALTDENGHKTAILDLNGLRAEFPHPQALRKEFTDPEWEDADLLVIDANWNQYSEVKSISKLAKELKPTLPIFLTGGLITALPKETLQLLPQVDGGLVGEVEGAFPELLKATESLRWELVPNCFYRLGGEVRRTKPLPLIENLDTIPHPAYSIFGQKMLNKYFQYSPIPMSPRMAQSQRRIDIGWQRGLFRDSNAFQGGMNWIGLQRIWGRAMVEDVIKDQPKEPVRFPSVNYCIREMHHLRVRYGVDYFRMTDPEFMLEPKRLAEFCGAYTDTGLDAVPWSCLGDVAHAQRDRLLTMLDAGCDHIAYPLRSNSERILQCFGLNPSMNWEALSATKQAMISFSVSFAIGWEKETLDDLLETLYFCIRADIGCDPSILIPEPGSEGFTESYYYREELERFLEDTGNPLRVAGVRTSSFSADISTDILESRYYKVVPYVAIFMQYLMRSRDLERILESTHLAGVTHAAKWMPACPVCKMKINTTTPPPTEGRVHEA